MMKRKINIAVLFSFFYLNAVAQFGLFASAVFLEANGTSTFYNNTSPGLGQNIGTSPFQNTDFGLFTQNTGTLKLRGAEIKTFKGVSDNVCSGSLNYTVYPNGSRPVSPIFTSVDLNFFSNCNAPSCGSFFGAFSIGSGGGCCSNRDQKWQNPGPGTPAAPANIDLTVDAPGAYTLELYYSFTGQDGGAGCITTKYDNNGGNITNYTANFTITAPVPVRFGNLVVFNNDLYNNLYWKTYTEEQTEFFFLERAGDNMDFYPIGKIPAAGYSSLERFYTLRDNDPLNGNNYYRISMKETGGSYQFSGIVKTANKKNQSIIVINDPAKRNIQLKGIEKGDKICIFNPGGSMIFDGQSTGNYFNIETNTFSNGIYYLKVMNNHRSITRQITIAH